MKRFCIDLARAWVDFGAWGHPMEVGYDFQQQLLPSLLEGFNRDHKSESEPMPWLAALICCSVFDLALHDAYGQLHARPVYETYGAEFMSRDLGHFLAAAPGCDISFRAKYPQDFLQPRANEVPAWHLVGGLD